MKTENITMYSPNFGAVKFQEGSKISKRMQNVILDTPAIKNFGKKYDAEIKLQEFLGELNPSKTTLGISLENIKPKSILERISEHFRRPLDYLNFNTFKQDEEGMLMVLKHIDKNRLVDMHKM